MQLDLGYLINEDVLCTGHCDRLFYDLESKVREKIYVHGLVNNFVITIVMMYIIYYIFIILKRLF